MPDLPTHPDAGDGSHVRPSHTPTSGPFPWRRVAWIAVAVVAVVVFVVLHLTGVIGPESH